MPINNYPYSDYNNLNLDYILKEVARAVASSTEALLTSKLVKESVDNLDVTKEVNETLSRMEQDGTLSSMIEDIMQPYVSDIEASGKRDIILISDSYGVGTYPDGPNIRSFAEKVKNTVESISSGERVVHVSSVNGSGFAVGSSGTFKDQLQRLTESLTSDQKRAVKLILVVGGANDTHASADAIGAAMESFGRYCSANYPSAAVKVMMVGNVVTGLTTASYGYTSLLNTRKAYVIGCRRSNMGYVHKAWYLMGLNTFFSPDYLHPNEDGQNSLFLGVMNAINDESIETVTYATDQLEASALSTGFSFDYIGLNISNESVYITFKNTSGQPVSFNSNERKLVGHINSAFLQYAMSRSLVILGGKPFNFEIQNGDIYLRNSSAESVLVPSDPNTVYRVELRGLSLS